MRRELRRHPVQGKQAKTRTAQPTRAVAGAGAPPAPRSTGARSPVPGGMRTVLQPRWFREVRDELRKVTWPTVEQTRSLTLVVLVVAALLGLFLGGLDYGFNWLIENTVLR